MAKRVKKTRVVDRGAKKILREMKSLEGATIDAGYFEGVPSGEPTVSIAEVATFNEFGTFGEAGGRSGAQIGRIPPRPFMRPAFDKNVMKYREVTKQLLKDLVGQRLGGLKILKTIGAMMVGDIKQEITNVREPPNAPSTLAIKGQGKLPLIDTGTMKNRADFRIKL